MRLLTVCSRAGRRSTRTILCSTRISLFRHPHPRALARSRVTLVRLFFYVTIFTHSPSLVYSFRFPAVCLLYPSLSCSTALSFSVPCLPFALTFSSILAFFFPVPFAENEGDSPLPHHPFDSPLLAAQRIVLAELRRRFFFLFSSSPSLPPP